MDRYIWFLMHIGMVGWYKEYYYHACYISSTDHGACYCARGLTTNFKATTIKPFVRENEALLSLSYLGSKWKYHGFKYLAKEGE